MTINNNFFDDLWENFKVAKGDEAKLELFKEAMIASKLVLEENGHNSRIIYELLLELERQKDGYTLGPLNPKRPKRLRDFLALTKRRNAVVAVELHRLMGKTVDEACELVGPEVKRRGQTVKRWRRDKPADCAEVVEQYKDWLENEFSLDKKNKFLSEKLKQHIDLAKG